MYMRRKSVIFAGMTDFDFLPDDVSTGSIELVETPHRTDGELVEWIKGLLRKHGLCDRRAVYHKSHPDDMMFHGKPGWWSGHDVSENDGQEEKPGIWTVPLLLGGIYGERVKAKSRYVRDVELRTEVELREGSVVSDFRDYVLGKQWMKHLKLTSGDWRDCVPLSPDDFNWLQLKRFENIMKSAGARLTDVLYEIIPEG